MKLVNKKNNLLLEFNLNKIIKNHVYKALVPLDSKSLNRGSFYKLLNGERKTMGNWEIVC